MSLRLPLLVLLLIAATAPPAGAQRYPFRTFDEHDGMPMSAVNGVVQDSSGALWLAGRAGLAVYDGCAWRAESITSGVSLVNLARVAADDAGVLWAVRQNSPVRIYRRDRDGWVDLRDCPTTTWGRDVTAFAVTGGRDRPTVVATSLGGHRVQVWRDGGWREAVLPDGAAVRRLAWHDGTLHAATAAGLYTVADREGRVRVAPVAGLPAGEVYATVPAADGGLLAVGQGWIGRLEDGVFTPLAADPRIALPGAYAGVAAGRDSLGGLWCGDRVRVVHHHPDSGLEFLGRDAGMIANGVSDLTVDRGGQVWLVGVRGVSMLPDRSFAGWDREAGLFADEVTAVRERADGSILLGHEGGLTLLAPAPRIVPLGRQDRWGRVMALADAGGGELWLAAGSLGLGRLDRDLVPRWVLVPESSHSSIAAVAVGSDGTVWAGGSEGLWRGDGAAFARVDLGAPDDRAVPSVRRIVPADGGAVLVATVRRGVIRVAGDRVERFTSGREPEANSVYALHPAPDGGWWVGTATGLRRLDDTGIAPAGPQDPDIDRAVFAIAVDGRGRAWFGTDAGVRVWDGVGLRAVGVAEGLLGSETNRDAVTVDRRGRIWVGTDRGVTCIDERFGWDRAPAPAARVTGYVVDGLPRPADVPLALGADARELVIRLGSDSLAGPERVRFRTFLEGFDARWRDAGVLPDRTLRFTSLPPGTYRFQAQAVDARGRPGPVASLPPIRVAPPLWRRPSAIAAAAAAALGLVWLVATAVNGRRYARRLRREVAARTADLAASEQAVRRESQRLAVVLGSISDGVIVAGPDGRVGLGNAAAARLLGTPPGPLAGRRLEEVLPGVTTMLSEARAAQVTGSSSFVGRDAAIPYRVGASGRDLEIAVAPLEDATGSRVLAFRDVTGRRRSEDERMHARRLQSLGLLAGGIAHDFNNLLTIVLGNAAVARGTAGLPAAADAGLAGIEAAAARARDLTAQLLTFARGDAPRTRPVDLAALAAETAALVAADADLAVEADLAADLHPVAADPAQLGQVLQNVLMNARQAMPRGGRIRLRARNLADGAGGAMVELVIADEGPGIPAADLERIFEPYFTTKTGGTGLGLAIAYAIVARHGGRLAASSRPGEGAALTLSLPAALTAPAAGPVSAASS